MLTDSFLNSCFSIVLNKNFNNKRKIPIYKDILDVFNEIEKRENFEIPITFKSKVECLKKILEMLLKERSIESIIDSISFSEKYKQYLEFIQFKIEEEIKPEVFNDIIFQIRLRRKINSLFKNYGKLQKILEDIRDGNFDSVDNITDDYENVIKELYTNMMEENRQLSLETSTSLDLVKDDYTHVIDLIKKKYEPKNTTSSGFDVLDKEILPNRGFEPSRLYIIGGGSGSGKSTLLNNFILKSILDKGNSLEYSLKQQESTKITNVYIYITMENTIEESLMRTYQPMFRVTSAEMLRHITEGIDIKQKIIEQFQRFGSTVVMKYLPPQKYSPLDLYPIIDEVINEYGKNSIKGIYLDYLDLLKPDVRHEMYRLELSHITLSLKAMAVNYNLPVITVTQLGRGVYRVKNSDELNLDFMSESIKKVEHADFVMLMAKNDFQNGLVHAKVGKNRNGPIASIDFVVDFSKYLFINGSKVSRGETVKNNEEKEENQCFGSDFRKESDLMQKMNKYLG